MYQGQQNETVGLETKPTEKPCVHNASECQSPIGLFLIFFLNFNFFGCAGLCC